MHTYSIVARDAKTGEMGVGVQSHWFSVGSIVSWGEAGVGVVATQSFVNKSFGLKGLELLKNGKSPDDALEILLSADEGKDVRQVSILDSKGRVATHTGVKCIKHAGHYVGNEFSVQANMMLSDEVWPAMAKEFQNHHELPLAERIIKALETAELVGGDIRGKQSAAILIVSGEPAEHKWDDPLLDLRVEDHEEPLKELSRLVTCWRAYEHMNNADLAMEKEDMEKALKEYNAAQIILPDNLEMKYWTAVSLANTKNIEKAIELFHKVFDENRNWLTLTERIYENGLLTVTEDEFNKIINLD